jgi:hypothetical protein
MALTDKVEALKSRLDAVIGGQPDNEAISNESEDFDP